jgi:dienelactone hydrolase
MDRFCSDSLAAPGAKLASVLACVGADGPFVPLPQIVAFEHEMRQVGADWQVITYGGTVHSFTNPAADGSRDPGVRYSEQSDRRSWAAMSRFFDEVFARV